MTRRSFSAALAAAAAPGATQPPPLCAFSKHFHWTSVREAAALSKQFGFDGLDLTVRPGGHVLPERVKDDLPKAVEDARSAGLPVPMITAGIVDARTPHAEAILATMKQLGIRNYRWGGFRYDTKKTIPQQIEEFRAASKDLAAMNRQYGVCAMYHTHSGVGQFGASMWDIWLVLRDLDPGAVGVNLDVGHATVEGGLGGWINTTRLMAPVLRGVALKDFRWEKNARGRWEARWCPLGEGMVQFVPFLKMIKAEGFTGPLQLHMEYPELGDAHAGKQMTIPRADFDRMMKADVERMRGWLKEANI